MNNNYNDCTIEGSEMNIDNIFFYEDNNCTSQENEMSASTSQGIENEQMNGSENTSSTGAQNKHKRQKDSKYTQIKVNVGIDEDLKMILEMVIYLFYFSSPY